MADATEKPKAPPDASIIQEGPAKIEQFGNKVFYNKAQSTNRDISVAVLKQFEKIRREEIESGKLKQHQRRAKPIPNAPSVQPFLPDHTVQSYVAYGPVRRDMVWQEIQGLKIFEGLAASGLRSIRYALEVPGVGAVVACDLDSTAVAATKKHAEMNGVAEKVHALHADAHLHMLQHPQFYDVIDLDPYGTPVTFLDSAVQSVSDGGMLCVTATDSAVLCGGNPEVCYTKYGSISLKRGYCHEMAIRILLQCIDAHANRHKRVIVPVLSIHVDFYVRVFVRVYTSAQLTKFSPTKLALVYQSTACESFYFQPLCVKKAEGKSNPKFGPVIAPTVPYRCPETDSNFTVGGPIWMDPMHDAEWVKAILDSVRKEPVPYPTQAKVVGLLTTISEELLDAPLYVDLHLLCKNVHAVVPNMNYFTSAFSQHGFRVSLTHCNPKAFKTDAPFELVWDMIRAWINEQPLSQKPEPGTPIAKLLEKEMKYEIKFSNRPVSSARKAGVARFVPNPAQWGPMARHGRKQKAEDRQEGKSPKKHKQNS